MKEILRQMFNGWMLHEASWNGERYTRDKTDCMVEACGGDKIRGEMVYLFAHWGDDIQCLAPHFGLDFVRDKEGKLTINENVPPAPSPEHWWEAGAWVEPD